MKRENASIYWGIFLFTAENRGGIEVGQKIDFLYLFEMTTLF